MNVDKSNMPSRFMEMLPGPELDGEVTAELRSYVTISNEQWSTSPLAALRLLDLIEEHVNQVGILRFGADAPAIISQMAMIGPEDGATFVYTGSWMESLCKALILYQHGHTGNFFHPKFEEAKQRAPKRIVQ